MYIFSIPFISYCLGTTKLRNENETKRNEKERNVSQNETKYVKQSIKDPKTINEGVGSAIYRSTLFCCKIQKGQQKSCINTVNIY